MKYFNKHLGESKKEKIGINERIVRLKKEIIFCLTTVSTIFVFALVLFSIIENGLVMAYTGTADVGVYLNVTAEISLTVANSSLNFADIPGMTGGESTVSTTVTVITNSKDGYHVTLVNNASTTAAAAMLGRTQFDHIDDYTPATPGTPQTPWSDAGTVSEFGFGITYAGTGSFANTATGYTTCTAADSCWHNAPTSTAKTIMKIGSPTDTDGVDFTLKFKVHIPGNPNPVVVEDVYVATSTLTALID